MKLLVLKSAEDPPHLRKRWRSTLRAMATQEQIAEAMNAMQRPDRGVGRPAGTVAQAKTEWHKYWTDGRRNKHSSQSQGWSIQEG